jgi:iron complex outermembrane receptor protein
MKKIYFISLGFLMSFSLWAQSGRITGKVVDASDNHALAGATIRVSGKGGTSTDDNGNFNIPCDGSTEITVSFVGYRTYKTRVENCEQELTITLSPSNQVLNEVEITATSNPNRSLLYLPAAITKLNDLEIQRGNGLFLDDAINTNVPGVYMTRRAVSSGQQFNIRGYGSGVGFRGASNNFDGQGYKVYLNGIPITDAEGITLMDDIDFGSIGNVEVIKGPAGTLYGLAIAGVVNLETKKAESGQNSVGQNVLLGNYGLSRFTTQLQLGGDRSSVFVNYGRQHSDGFMPHNESDKNFFNFVGDFNPNENQKISAYVAYSNSYDQRAGELTIDQFNNDDYSGNARYIKNDAHSETISFRAGLSHTYRFSSQVKNTTTIFGSGLTNNASSAGGWTDKSPTNYGFRSTLDMNFGLSNGGSLSGIVGMEAQRQNAFILGYSMVTNQDDPNGYNVIGAMRSNQTTITSTGSYFTEWTLSLPSDISITGGLGFSTMDINLMDRIYNSTTSQPGGTFNANYKNMVSPHFAINKVFSSQLSAYASYSKGFKAPVSGNIVISTTGELNTGLKPEEGNQFEIGTKGSLLESKFNYQLALFSTEFKNKMTSVAVPLDANTTAYTYIANGGGQVNQGLELAVNYEAYKSNSGFFSNIRPFANLTLSDFTYKDFTYESLSGGVPSTANYDGNDVAGVSPVVANVGIDVTTNLGLYGNLNFSYKDAMPITSDGNNQSADYRIWNTKLGYRNSLSSHFDLDVYFGVNNIFGQKYYYMVFINQLSDAYIPAPKKANYFGGINLKYIF